MRLFTLLAEPIKFEEYKQQDGALKSLEGKYKALNGKTRDETDGDAGAKSAVKGLYSYDGSSGPVASSSKHTLDSRAPKDLFLHEVKLTFPRSIRRDQARGLDNLGNTCFANSILQVFLHTAPMLNVLDTITRERGYDPNFGVDSHRFSMTRELLDLKKRVWDDGRGNSVNPSRVLGNIKKICSSMRRGAQEDAHEFFRAAIDSMQDDALRVTGASKAAHDLRETTWVHKVWGGKIRSRVMCQECKKPSDTFDTTLDFSLDIPKGCENLKDALNASFARQERLHGKNAYRCENCKKLVEAIKSMKILKAPPVLSLHLKRFSPFGRKLTDLIKYGPALDLSPYVEGDSKAHYEIYAVTCHLGGGPHSGHYYSYVRGSNPEQWWKADDSSVSSVPKGQAMNQKHAYVLHYVRKPGSEFNDILSGKTGSTTSKQQRTAGIDSPMRKADADADVEDYDESSPVTKRPSNGVVDNAAAQASPSKTNASTTFASSSKDVGKNPSQGIAASSPLSKGPATSSPHSERKLPTVSPTSFYGNGNVTQAANAGWKGSFNPPSPRTNTPNGGPHARDLAYLQHRNGTQHVRDGGVARSGGRGGHSGKDRGRERGGGGGGGRGGSHGGKSHQAPFLASRTGRNGKANNGSVSRMKMQRRGL